MTGIDSDLHLTLLRGGNIEGITDVVRQAVQSVPSVPVLRWFGDRKTLLVVFHVCFITHPVSGGSPIACVVLVVAIERADIEHKGLAGYGIRGCVPVPAISVDQRRL